MGFSIDYVIARWDRPLTELGATAALDVVTPDEAMSWVREDGWQCFAPEGACWSTWLPPIADIHRETRGPVLGMSVESSSHWEVGFLLDGASRWIAAGPSENGPVEHFEAEMQARWGTFWQAEAATALASWISPVAEVDPLALRALLTIEHLFPERKLSDLQRLLTLVPAPDHEWWSYQDPDWTNEAQVPGALYAVEARALALPALNGVADRYSDKGLALAFTRSGAGVWDSAVGRWLVDPTRSQAAALQKMTELLAARGW